MCVQLYILCSCTYVCKANAKEGTRRPQKPCLGLMMRKARRPTGRPPAVIRWGSGSCKWTRDGKKQLMSEKQGRRPACTSSQGSWELKDSEKRFILQTLAGILVLGHRLLEGKEGGLTRPVGVWTCASAEEAFEQCRVQGYLLYPALHLWAWTR